ncbi:unnamed protein product [Clonostachys rhizophaga]|uniref:Uncharacterized protein n=1 Tax=Clonostachys rhizophaga TaxID=160324 RepID=A0A9N9V9D9_9HYPO|nr:unnamed protein product [Clonostachys rhizophaga]
MGESSPQTLDQGVEHPSVGNAQYYKEYSADRGPDDVSYSSKTIEALSEGATGGSNNDAGDDDNCTVAQTEEGADSCRSLPTGDQPSGGEVDGRDVVSVKRMPRGETWVEVEDDSSNRPDKDIDQNEASDDVDRVGGETLEKGRTRESKASHGWFYGASGVSEGEGFL